MKMIGNTVRTCEWKCCGIDRSHKKKQRRGLKRAERNKWKSNIRKESNK